ncbi:MAG: formate dehydrogenase accessory sulfurtransferase FdhD [Xanthobacteraceae bacterium]|nr:formate dehydrogenase accessory sulfurtransferase FdhD [Xanthobacteraceae bacterium]
MQDPVHIVHRQIWRDNGVSSGERAVAEETAVALTYNGGSYAVMMATPRDLEDFATGFSLTEGIIAAPSEIDSLDVVPQDDGVELRMWLRQATAERLAERRRHIAGPTGCGLCGIDSIAEAVRPAAVVAPGGAFTAGQVMAAMAALTPLQTLNLATRAVHASAFWTPKAGIIALREDVGRHNALDKLAGALARSDTDPTMGMVLLTSRVSVEMVQKAAVIGAPVIASVSAPTALAVRMAAAAGITLVAIARHDGFEIFSHHHRLNLSRQPA